MGHLLCFQVILANGDRLWPALIYPKAFVPGMEPLTELQAVERLLEQERELSVSVIRYDRQGCQSANHNQRLAKEDLYMIQGPIRSYNPYELSVSEVFGLSEAARLWGIEGGGATIRKALERGDFRADEIRKSDGVLLVTYPGMQRRYNAVMKGQWGEIRSYLVHKGAIQEETHKLLMESEISPAYKPMSLIARRQRKASSPDKHG